MKTHIGSLIAAITFAVAASTAYADGDIKYPQSNELQPAQPSSHSSTRKVMRVADRRLSRDVRGAIGKGGGVDMSRLGVIARSGKVRLVGTVPDEGEIDIASQRAQSVTGVTNVSNNLSIRVPGGN
jgi:hyperosmotically inducible protein